MMQRKTQAERTEMTPQIARDDFARALQEMGTYMDVSVDDLLQVQTLAMKHARMRKTQDREISSLMTQPVISIAPDCSLSDAAHLLVTHRISGLPIVDESNKLLGIITEADFLRALGVPSHHPGHHLWQTLENMFHPTVQVRETEGTVAELMVREVVTLSDQANLHDALELMKQHRIKRLVVCDESQQVVGMLTRSNLVRVFFDHFISQQAVAEE
jgi:CBS-domain-containing membrane protein